MSPYCMTLCFMYRRIVESAKEQAQRHKQALEDADRSHERASKYLHKTLEKSVLSACHKAVL